MWAAIEARLKVCDMFSVDCSNQLEEQWQADYEQCLYEDANLPRLDDWCSGEDDNCGSHELCCGEAVRIDENGN